MRTTTVFLLLVLSLFSCKRIDADNRIVGGIHISTGIYIFVKDKDGNDLLNPATPNGIKERDIRIYNLVNGKIKEIFNPNMDLPRDFKIRKYKGENTNANDSAYVMLLYLNSSKTENPPITYIKWNETDTDTIKAKFDYPGYSVILEKAWYNGNPVGKVKWPYIEIIK